MKKRRKWKCKLFIPLITTKSSNLFSWGCCSKSTFFFTFFSFDWTLLLFLNYVIYRRKCQESADKTVELFHLDSCCLPVFQWWWQCWLAQLPHYLIISKYFCLCLLSISVTVTSFFRDVWNRLIEIFNPNKYVSSEIRKTLKCVLSYIIELH